MHAATTMKKSKKGGGGGQTVMVAPSDDFDEDGPAGTTLTRLSRTWNLQLPFPPPLVPESLRLPIEQGSTPDSQPG